MSRRAILTAIPAAAIAAAIGVGVIGSPVDAADAARPFSVTKSQFTSVKKNASTALDKSKQNAKEITKLKQSGVAGPQGLQGPPGAGGGFDRGTVIRFVGPVVPVPAAETYVPYSLPCPAGTIALSGGWSAPTADSKYVRVARSYPAGDLSAWNFRFAYSSVLGTIDITPYIVCA